MKLYKKIDLFFEGKYLCSTNQAKTCREAVDKYLVKLESPDYYIGRIELAILSEPNKLKAFFDKERK